MAGFCRCFRQLMTSLELLHAHIVDGDNDFSIGLKSLLHHYRKSQAQMLRLKRSAAEKFENRLPGPTIH